MTNTIKATIANFEQHWNLKFEFRLVDIFSGEKEHQNIINLIEYDGSDSEQYRIVFDVDIQKDTKILEFSFFINGKQDVKVFELPDGYENTWYTILVNHACASQPDQFEFKVGSTNDHFWQVTLSPKLVSIIIPIVLPLQVRIKFARSGNRISSRLQ